jgi:4-hydroxybenzoyl-CoA thioesterase
MTKRLSPPFLWDSDTEQLLFTRSYAVRFAHCDPAGIVFFPQYFVLLNGFIEDWFNQGLGIAYAELIVGRRVGLPTVSLQCDFVAPSRMGENIEFGLRVERVGGSSIALHIGVRGANGPRLQLRQVLVTTDMDRGCAIALHDDLQAALKHWVVQTGIAAL